ncbi:cuticle protein CP14.6-like [Anoplophora glabripennis]|uniref:cuticle protein CP14.6-like n=1 Tax=Anoplophora glabripennis TaxID=217634 RepID=UPI0008753C83|nr:cuticle protein CP14.6-like [Anoplophora glabripennis]
MTMELKVILLTFYIYLSVDCRPEVSMDAKIERYDFNIQEPGSFDFSVATSDGFHHDVKGRLDKAGGEDESLVITGTYSYMAPDGVVYTITYVADKNGFQPIGDHIPQFKATTTAPYKIEELLEDFSIGCIASLCGTGLG